MLIPPSWWIRWLREPRSFGEPWVRIVAATLLAVTLPLLACGPFFPSSLLLSGDDAVLRAPDVGFLRELDRLQLPPPPGLVHPASDANPREQTVLCDLADVKRALETPGSRRASSNEIASTLLAYSRMRSRVEEHRAAMNRWIDRRTASSGSVSSAESEPPPAPAGLDIPNGVPTEFATYLRAASAWHDRRTQEARAAWSALLALPHGQRAYRSTWASYMLGRSWHDEDPARAMAFYQETRRLARQGFADNAGLAVASLGWEAQIHLRTNHLAKALALYLDQYAAGATSSAGPSLRLVARRIVEADPELRAAIARVPMFRQVVTAWLLANESWESSWNRTAADLPGSLAERWLGTIETVGAGEVPLAEQLAVLCYQLGRWDDAHRWLDLAADSTVARWIHAKLLLREGNLDRAAETLSTVVRDIAAHEATDTPRVSSGALPSPASSKDFLNSLFESDDAEDIIPAQRKILGELGMLRLTRGEFEMALDALLRGGFWQDAAYVAERVLTLGELCAYVDRTWPATATTTRVHRDGSAPGVPHREIMNAEPRERIRYLLARRLTRSNRGAEAGPYYPVRWQEAHARLMRFLSTGEDTSRSNADRARAWVAAAWLTRTNGLELIATECGPDWAIWDGQFAEGPTPEARTALQARHLTPFPTELPRAKAHHADPERRFHYRYHAAMLAWQAAQLMPDDDPATARVLYDAGGWLKVRDPRTADLFYKALVRRCRHTELGAEADRQRWFPSLDASGKPF